MEGVLQEGALYRVLLELAARRRTGILTVQGDEEIIAFSLLDGEVVAADALNTTLEEALGELLVRRQLVRAEDYGGLAAEYQSGGGRVIDLLVERAYLTREQLLTILREHTYRLSLEAFTWQSGEYRFYEGEEVAYEEDFRPLGVDELAVRATTDLGPSGPLRGGVASGAAIVHRLAAADTAGEELAAPLAGAVAAPAAAEAFSLFNGRRSVEAVAAASGLSLFTVRHLVQRWVGEGLVTVSDETPAPEPRFDGLASATVGGEVGAEADLADRPVAPPSLDEVELEGPGEVPERAPARRPARRPARDTPWPSRILGLALWAAAIGLLVAQPASLLLPFPWQGGLRDALQKEQRAALHLKIEGAATTFFLLNGRFPEELEELVAARLLSRRDLSDPSGRSLVMSSATASYLVQSVVGGGSEEDLALQATIAGNLLLDPAFAVPEEAGEPPLVLLD